jgi:hypothetical protein
MSEEVANAQLSVADIPSFMEAWSRIEPFALTFDGYQYWGSIDKCAEVAAKTPATLTHLRTCLFFEARRWSHLKKQPDEKALKRIRALVFAIKEKVKNGDLR